MADGELSPFRPGAETLRLEGIRLLAMDMQSVCDARGTDSRAAAKPGSGFECNGAYDCGANRLPISGAAKIGMTRPGQYRSSRSMDSRPDIRQNRMWLT